MYEREGEFSSGINVPDRFYFLTIFVSAEPNSTDSGLTQLPMHAIVREKRHVRYLAG